jgi:hypothetical protein
MNYVAVQPSLPKMASGLCWGVRPALIFVPVNSRIEVLYHNLDVPEEEVGKRALFSLRIHCRTSIVCRWGGILSKSFLVSKYDPDMLGKYFRSSILEPQNINPNAHLSVDLWMSV